MGHWLGIILGLGILAALAVGTLSWVGSIAWFFTVHLYRAAKYDRRGLCYKCKKPFAEERTAPADQMYGPSAITQSVCSCGNVSIVAGNRRFAEW